MNQKESKSMPDLSLDQTPQGWDAVVEEYERVLEPLTAEYAEEALRLAELKPGERILDVAAGSGGLTLTAARASAQVVAIDFSPQMIKRLCVRLEKEGIANATAEVMDGQALEFPNGVFDAAFSVFGLMFFPDRAKGFEEMLRILRPGGRAAVVVWASGGFRFSRFLTQAINTAIANFSPLRPPPGTELQDPKRLEAEMRNAHFKQVNIHTVTRTWSTPSPAWLWDHAKGHSPVVTAIFEKLEELGPESVDAARKVFLEILHREFGSGRLLLEREAHIGIGVK